MNFSAKLRFYFHISKSFLIKVEKLLWFPALQRKVSRGCGGGYSGYGYRSYSFPGGGKVPFGDLRIVSSIYIDYKYIINIYL